MNDQLDILIAEDSPTQAAQLRHILEQQGYRVSVVHNGRDALSAVCRHQPTLLLSDIVMPEMDGFELCRQIRADQGLRGLPVILLTALSDPKDVIRALACGATNFIQKPYDGRHLLSRIHQVLANIELRRHATVEMGVNVLFAGEQHYITAERLQILDLLLATYETAVRENAELSRTRDELQRLNEQLEGKVAERTAVLREEIAERRRTEEALGVKCEEVRDMTQQLWQAAKLATVGELAASIAHELNNPLATVSLRVESLLGRAGADNPERQALEIVSQEVERMAGLVANLLQFSRRSPQRISTLDVRQEIEGTLELIHYHLRNHRINVATEFAADVPLIQADRQQLRQVLLNLLTNASDAMPQGGTLTLRTKAQGNRILVEVADTGTGIGPADLSRVMEPFFTTKGEGKGTGLGLAICRRIVKEHQGTICLESVVGQGTVVRIELPAENGANAAMLKEA